MLSGYSPEIQTLLGTLLTWGLTAAGAGLVFFVRGSQRRFLDCSLGFAAGVMLAASYWSLLAPAIEMAADSTTYGESGEHAYIPAAVGFFFGALFVYVADQVMSHYNIGTTSLMIDLNDESKNSPKLVRKKTFENQEEDSGSSTQTMKRRHGGNPSQDVSSSSQPDVKDLKHQEKWRRILLLVVAVTVHNIPEGLAVGVGFGAVGKSSKATFESARNLAIGIGIQNFPEGLAVSLPLRGSGLSVWKSFWYGQLSGMVEPVAGLLGVMGVSWVEPSLPYALAFAAGAMVYVVVNDLIPEAASCGNGRLASWGAIVGFVVMMVLDVGLA